MKFKIFLGSWIASFASVLIIAYIFNTIDIRNLTQIFTALVMSVIPTLFFTMVAPCVEDEHE